DVFQFQSDGLVQIFEGRIGIEVKPEWGTAGFKEHMRGNAISALLRRCTWGFGEEPVGLMSEMALGINEKMDRFRDLKLADSISDDELGEYQKLEKGLQRHGLVLQYEQEEFFDFMKKRHERGLVFPATHPVTRSQSQQAGRASRWRVRERTSSRGRPGWARAVVRCPTPAIPFPRCRRCSPLRRVPHSSQARWPHVHWMRWRRIRGRLAPLKR